MVARVQSANCPRLNATFTGFRPRMPANTMSTATAWATTTVAGRALIKPATMTISLNENECEWASWYTCTTINSDATKAAARARNGMWWRGCPKRPDATIVNTTAAAMRAAQYRSTNQSRRKPTDATASSAGGSGSAPRRLDAPDVDAPDVEGAAGGSVRGREGGSAGGSAGGRAAVGAPMGSAGASAPVAGDRSGAGGCVRDGGGNGSASTFMSSQLPRTRPQGASDRRSARTRLRVPRESVDRTSSVPVSPGRAPRRKPLANREVRVGSWRSGSTKMCRKVLSGCAAEH